MSVVSNPPCGDYCLNACLEFDDSDLRVLVQRHDGHAKRVRQASETVGLVLVVERVEHLHCWHKAVRWGDSGRAGQLASH
jgi:hypothetical protein